MRLVSGIRATSRSPLLQVAKTSAAAVVAWLLCNLILNQPLPIFAAIAALLVVQPSVNQSLLKGVERSIGVIAGVALAFAVGQVFGNASWIVLSVIVASLILAWALKLGPGSANQIPISAMLVLAIGSLSPEFAIDRILETIIGAAVGLVINLAIVPPVLLQPAHLAVGRLLGETAKVLEELAISLRESRSPAELESLLEHARSLRSLRESATDAVVRGEESLMLNPRRGRHRRVLEHDTELLARLSVLVTRVLGMARAIHDHHDPAIILEPAARPIATELDRAAHDLRLLGRDPEGVEPATITAELPALTAPLVIGQPSRTNWILIGSLLEDLRRVREEIVGSSES